MAGRYLIAHKQSKSALYALITLHTARGQLLILPSMWEFRRTHGFMGSE